MEDIAYFRCVMCEKTFPNRKANIFAFRKQLRTHLRKEHGLKHQRLVNLPMRAFAKHDNGNSCHCLSKKDDKGKPMYMERVTKEIV